MYHLHSILLPSLKQVTLGISFTASSIKDPPVPPVCTLVLDPPEVGVENIELNASMCGLETSRSFL